MGDGFARFPVRSDKIFVSGLVPFIYLEQTGCCSQVVGFHVWRRSPSVKRGVFCYEDCWLTFAIGLNLGANAVTCAPAQAGLPGHHPCTPWHHGHGSGLHLLLSDVTCVLEEGEWLPVRCCCWSCARFRAQFSSFPISFVTDPEQFSLKAT